MQDSVKGVVCLATCPSFKKAFQLGYQAYVHTLHWTNIQAHDVRVHRRPTTLDSCLRQSAHHTQVVNDIFLDAYCQLNEQPGGALHQTLTIPQESFGIGLATRGVAAREGTLTHQTPQRTYPRLPCFSHVQSGAFNLSGFFWLTPGVTPGVSFTPLKFLPLESLHTCRGVDDVQDATRAPQVPQEVAPEAAPSVRPLD